MKFRQARIDSGEKRKQRWITIAIGIFLILIMATSVMNFWGEEGEGAYMLFGNKYAETEQGFVSYAGDKQIILLTEPGELENVTIGDINRESIGILNGLSKRYLVYNPKEDVKYAVYNFKRNIPLASPVVEACWEDNELCRDMPLKGCEDASDSVGVILFRQANQSRAYFESGCLVFEGESLLKIVDKFIAMYYAKEEK